MFGYRFPNEEDDPNITAQPMAIGLINDPSDAYSFSIV